MYRCFDSVIISIILWMNKPMHEFVLYIPMN